MRENIWKMTPSLQTKIFGKTTLKFREICVKHEKIKYDSNNPPIQETHLKKFYYGKSVIIFKQRVQPSKSLSSNRDIHLQYLWLWKCQKFDLACLQCNVCDKGLWIFEWQRSEVILSRFVERNYQVPHWSFKEHTPKIHLCDQCGFHVWSLCVRK